MKSLQRHKVLASIAMKSKAKEGIMQIQKQDIKESILCAGKQEYLEKGFRGGKISNIAQKANVPVGNLYRYFDGKNGLLDALVRDTYKSVPDIILQYMQMEEIAQMSLFGQIKNLTNMLSSLFEKHGMEIIILSDKCEGTKYEDFSEKLFMLVNMHLEKYVFKKNTKEDIIFCSIISRAFLSTIIDILRKCKAENLKSQISRLLIFFFLDVQKRI
jgi:AcrR family transcriptional regulator